MNVDMQKVFEVISFIRERASEAFLEKRDIKGKYLFHIDEKGIYGTYFNKECELTKQELEMVTYLLGYHMGISDVSQFPEEHKMFASNPQMLAQSEVPVDYPQFVEYVKADRARLKEKMLGTVRYLTSINNRDREPLYFEISPKEHISVNGDGICIRDPYIQGVCEEILVEKGAKKNEQGSYTMEDTEPLWRGTCLDENYDLETVLSAVANQAAVVSSRGSRLSTVIVTDFSIGEILFPNGVSPTVKKGVVEVLKAKCGGRLQGEIGEEVYEVFTPDIQMLVDEYGQIEEQGKSR